jgi:hypothetical protein
MNHYKLNIKRGKKAETIKFQIPTSWKDITFGQLAKIFELVENNLNDDIALISILTNLDENILRLCEANENYLSVKDALSFFADGIPNINYVQLSQAIKFKDEWYATPTDVGLLSIEMFEYCRAQIINYQNNESPKASDLLFLMKKIFAHYAYFVINKKYKSLDVNLDKSFLIEIDNCRWADVCGFANFFLRKLEGLTIGTNLILNQRNTQQTKLMRALNGLINVGALRWFLKKLRSIISFLKKNF